MVGQNTCQALKNHFMQAYRWYHIHKKSTAADYEYGTAANHVQETDYQIVTADAL